ncbi:MAG: hypothetical protein PHZ19_02100 [Candidatus Thermoplasmatota archaeon]|nr:hypothetical protein [Candidatus Thermoplasmatota archaeon]
MERTTVNITKQTHERIKKKRINLMATTETEWTMDDVVWYLLEVEERAEEEGIKTGEIIGEVMDTMKSMK